MNQSLLTFLFIFTCLAPLSSEETFLLINGTSNEKILELGTRINERMAPFSTFKIVLSLMGYEEGILKDENNPLWNYQEGYDDFKNEWKHPQTPKTWIKTSCFWYSKVLASLIGLDKFQHYLVAFNYGNQDASGGLTKAWVNSSLMISPKEQVNFIQNMVLKRLPISDISIQMTKKILFIEELPKGWKLFGKTGWSGSQFKPDGKNEIGWFVGWIEKNEDFFPFAYVIIDSKIKTHERIPRVKHLIESNLFCE